MKNFNLKSKSLFKFLFGVGAPVFFMGANLVAFKLSMVLGVLFLMVLVLRVWDSFRTTCCRCGFYGSGACGLPSLVVPMFYEKTTASVSEARIRFHYGVDILVILMALGLYAAFDLRVVFIALIWPIGAYFISFGPKRYHGLLSRIESSHSFEV